MHPTFDDRDAEILAERTAQRERRKGPRIGDFCRFPDGSLGRFSHDWGDEIQWSEGGSFYLCAGGGASFSGGLYPSIPKARLKLSRAKRAGQFWFFHHNHACAHNGVDVEAPCRVYRVTGETFDRWNPRG
jgi:hypothetical protein